MPAGVPVAGGWNFGGGPTNTPNTSPTSMFGNPSTFTAAANTQASDYDKIMANYSNFVNTNSGSAIAPASVTPQQIAAPAQVQAQQIAPTTSPYTQSPDVTTSLSGLSNLVTTGGYSDANIADIRARDISPIRSIYSNAQQNVERQKALSGGYSPNYDAVQAQSARDEANQIATTTTAANAGIAQNVAANELAAAPAYASASATANAAKTQADQNNASIVNQINQANATNTQQAGEFNTGANINVNQQNAANTLQANEFNTNAALQSKLQGNQQTLGAIQGMSSLYGTTPALTNTFGNQVMQANQQNQNQQQVNNQQNQNLWGNIGRSLGA